MFTVNGQAIGKRLPPYIIAELSANHGGSIERAKASIQAAKAAGASAVKIQSYTPDTMTIDCDKPDFQIKSGLWKGSSLYSLYKQAYTPYEWHQELFTYAAQIGITLFSSPFDETAVDLLASLDAPAYKIASFELTDIPLIEYTAKQKRPMFMSTGMASLAEIAEAVQACKQQGNDEILLFHCISSYPAPTEESNLLNITAIAKEFDVELGLSDHTISNLAAIMSIGLGAVAVEKHFKLDDKDCGPDASFSLLPSQLSSLVQDCQQASLALGDGDFERTKAESDNSKFRRSLYFVKDLPEGAPITQDAVRRIRPGFGLAPKHLDKIMGQSLTKAVERGDPVTWDCFS
ncbi:pseudaminic acid synthase [Glaciecola siphonariae]|uniref:Pseudaminic acid synthase n=1 Tax=Glaciecola siphonariae TaxID=521012 RepID=A0ABV9LWU5_9ALTE